MFSKYLNFCLENFINSLIITLSNEKRVEDFFDHTTWMVIAA